MRIDHWNEPGDGALSEQAMRRKLEGLGYAVSRYTYPPGTYFPTHVHGVDKIDGVLSGRFRIEIEHESVVLEPGDLLWVPAGTPHSAEVVGKEAVVSLDAERRG